MDDEFEGFEAPEPPRTTGQAPKTKMTPEQVIEDRIESLRDTPLETTGKPPSDEAVEEAKRLAAGTLMRASALLPPDVDQDMGDFEPGAYKGFEIVPPDEWPTVKAHARIERRFYVRHNDTFGMVPWPGSQIVWPWEAGWEQDLHRDTVTSFLKEEKKETKKRG